MSGSSPVADVVHAWLAKAEDDLRAAELILAAGDDGPSDAAAYHAQQCVEKCLKALFVRRGVDCPRTHDIAMLVALLSEAGIEPPDLSAEEQVCLTAYATSIRYPGDYEPVSREEAVAAVVSARRVRGRVRSVLNVDG